MRSKHGSPCDEGVGGTKAADGGTLIRHFVLAKVSFSSVEEEEGDDGEASLQNYISREDRDYFNTLTQEICDSVVNSGGAQEEGEEQDSEASASRPSGKRKRAVKLPEEEAKGVREAILRKLPVQHVMQRSGRVSRKPRRGRLLCTALCLGRV